jgi:hypothetical protein
MNSWVTCTTTEGIEIRLNLGHVAMIRPYHSDRGFKGSEVIFATGTPSPIIVKEDRNALAAAKAHDQDRSRQASSRFRRYAQLKMCECSLLNER